MHSSLRDGLRIIGLPKAAREYNSGLFENTGFEHDVQ